MTALGMLLAFAGTVLIYSGVKGRDVREAITTGFKGGKAPEKVDYGDPLTPATKTAATTAVQGAAAGIGGAAVKYKAPTGGASKPQIKPPGYTPHGLG